MKLIPTGRGGWGEKGPAENRNPEHNHTKPLPTSAPNPTLPLFDDKMTLKA
jgi:hypothetical protein